MIKDYKNRVGNPSPGHHHFRPLALSALPLALVASGLYAALQIMEPAPINKEQVTSVEKPLQSYSLALPDSTQKALASPAAQTTLEPSTLEPATGPQLAQPIPQPITEIKSPATKPTLIEEPLVSEQATPKIAMLEEAPIKEPTDPLPSLQWQEHQVRSGDSLARIFPKLGLSANLLHRIVNSSKAAAGLAKIRPGEKLRVALNDNGTLHQLILQHSAIKSLKIVPEGDGFDAKILERELEPRTTHVSGTVQNSLYMSAQKAGLADKLIMELANIFGWDVDFALEIRAGDHFSVIYQEDYLDGKKFRDGPILAAEFVNKGRIFRAVRYVDESGWADYFTPEGKSVRKAFLRSPVDFRRISSRFQRERWHPVLGKKRPHRGVDYAAATGTPIKAAGDGRIQFRARKGGYGKAVVIEHGGGITTLYGHLSRYKAKQRKGTRVRQGDTIGYVGSTGLASGPHLHYEFRVNGVHRNPLTVKLPSANPIAKKYRDDFFQQATPLMARLDILNKTMLADAN
ncbi:peptidoglycan DD-metalloendopeptidase family protein [Pseudomonadota bacterium]